MCEYCRGKEFNKPIIYNSDADVTIYIADGEPKLWADNGFIAEVVDIKYCPMCGRNQEEKKNE